MDRNTLIGFALIFLILIGYSVYIAQQPTPKQEKPAIVQTAPATAPILSATPTDSATIKQKYGEFASGGFGQEKDIVLENKDLRMTIGTRGGRVKEVTLKNYKTYTQKPLVLFDEKSMVSNLTLPTRTGNINLSELYFTTTGTSKVVAQGDSAQVSFRLELANNQYVEQTYTLRGSGYQIGYDLKLTGLDPILKNEPVQLYWLQKLKLVEKDRKTTQLASSINYYTREEAFEDIGDNSVSLDEKTVAEPIQWVSMKEKFFLTALIARGTTSMSGAQFKSSVDERDTSYIKILESTIQLPIADLKSGKAHYDYYFGPNEYETVKNVADGFRENVYLGWPVIRVVSRFLILPVFNLLDNYILNYGLLILVLVLVVKTVLFPLVYRSYMSMAKMRVMQPEVDAIKAKHGDDMQKIQADQMKLYSQVGVSPLSGCVPMLLQMPILFSLFSLFPNLIEFRQKAFWWAEDLSTYDSLIQLPFALPFVGASHISMFAVLMTASSLAFTYYNSQMTTSSIPGPYKTIQYFMPVVILFVLNASPAGLNFYYLVSNLVTIGQQLTIRQFVDEDLIRKKLEENREKNKDKKKTGFQARLEEAMRKAEEAKKENETRSSSSKKNKK